MAKIVLSKNAPEGQPLAAAFGPYRFDAKGGEYYESDDENLLAAAEAHPFFEVDRSDDEAETAKEQQREADRERKQRAQDDKVNATKDPAAPPAEVQRAAEGEGDK